MLVLTGRLANVGAAKIPERRRDGTIQAVPGHYELTYVSSRTHANTQGNECSHVRALAGNSSDLPEFELVQAVDRVASAARSNFLAARAFALPRRYNSPRLAWTRSTYTMNTSPSPYREDDPRDPTQSPPQPVDAAESAPSDSSDSSRSLSKPADVGDSRSNDAPPSSASPTCFRYTAGRPDGPPGSPTPENPGDLDAVGDCACASEGSSPTRKRQPASRYETLNRLVPVLQIAAFRVRLWGLDRKSTGTDFPGDAFTHVYLQLRTTCLYHKATHLAVGSVGYYGDCLQPSCERTPESPRQPPKSTLWRTITKFPCLTLIARS